MEYEEIKLIKQKEKSTVHLVKEKGGERMFVKKTLSGQHPVYQLLQDNPHPCLPRLQEVVLGENSTVIIEEYIEGEVSGAVQLSEKQFRQVVRELCSVLEFLHGKGIIHRDIKPSNILLTKDGHVRLIDFDAARMPKEGREQDTRLLGTRGYAPPEQYGFAQTDERTDIYALGVTLEQLLGEQSFRSRYKKILRKCVDLNPDKRYQTVREVRQAFFHTGRNVLCGAAALILLAFIFCGIWYAASEDGEQGLTVLDVPGNPHWDGETGTAMWDTVLESGNIEEVRFHMRLYRRDEAAPPDPDEEGWCFECDVRIGGGNREKNPVGWSIVPRLEDNGFYYFTVSALGDGISYTDSPYVVSDAFLYKGEEAPELSAPTGLAWKIYEIDNNRYYYATWDNMDDYEDKDTFNVTFYDETDTYVMNNTWTKEAIIGRGYEGIPIRAEYMSENGKYRFTVQVYSSRPNEYQSSPMPDPIPEEYYSPWLSLKYIKPDGEDGAE